MGRYGTGARGAGEHLRYFFEAGVPHTPLWPDDVDSPYGSPCELELLPVTQALRAELTRLCEWYQSSIDWDYPPDPSPWPAEERARFNRRADAALSRLRSELPDGWTVEDRRPAA